MRKFSVSLVGQTPLLMHADNIEWADKLDEWKSNPDNKKNSRAGDDRTPAWRWTGYTYHDGTHICVPSDNLMRCMMEGGAMVPVPGARGNKTFKAQTQSGMMVDQAFAPLLVGDARIPVADIQALLSVEDFAKHKQAARALGFSLFGKRVKVGAAKHIRVRPRFDKWALGFTVSAWDEQITQQVLSNILNFSGQYKGLGDWRPGTKTPGPYGMFAATVSEQ